MNDNFRHQGLRLKLVELLRNKGIANDKVLMAISKIPRHLFLDKAFLDFAYQDKAFPIAAGQTISHPYTVAFQTEVLAIKKGDKVLEIGTGSGYQTAVLFHLGALIYSIERQHYLFDKTKQLLSLMRVKAHLKYGDGYEGIEEQAPFDKIIITAGAPVIPKKLFDQLVVGGMMIIPIGIDEQVMTLIIKTSASSFEKIEYDNFNQSNFKFVPMLKNKK